MTPSVCRHTRAMYVHLETGCVLVAGRRNLKSGKDEFNRPKEGREAWGGLVANMSSSAGRSSM
jgi:hypothetical protein